jgi:guanine deaminase
MEKFELISLAIELAIKNVEQGTGGPFGAVIYDPKQYLIVGKGSNSVVPDNDPTAHAEVNAARDAIKNLGKKDLRGLECYTSCECCPMCLSYLLDAGISKIYFAASRKDAATAHFSDDQQYELLKKGYDANCSYSSINSVVIESFETESVDKLRHICKASNSFHLPQDFVFECNNKPHPFSLIALDWARVGRIRDKENPDDPEKDLFEKDVSKILYGSEEFEKLFGHRKVEDILDVVANGSEDIKCITHPDKLKPFELWEKVLQVENAKRY